MPKTIFDKFSKSQPPPIDWLWACILERKMQRKLSLQDIAKMAEVSYSAMRGYIRESPWAWPKEVRDRICKELGVKVIITPEMIKTEGNNEVSCVRVADGFVQRGSESFVSVCADGVSVDGHRQASAGQAVRWV